MCWRPEEGYGRAPNAIDIPYGSLGAQSTPGHVQEQIT